MGCFARVLACLGDCLGDCWGAGDWWGDCLGDSWGARFFAVDSVQHPGVRARLFLTLRLRLLLGFFTPRGARKPCHNYFAHPGGTLF